MYRRSGKTYGRFRPLIAMLSPKVKIKGIYWDFHKGDNDSKPSVPHGHGKMKDGVYKLELWNGKIYKVQNRKLVYKYMAKEKDMEALYKYPDFLDFIQECREEYENRFPHISLPDLSPQNTRSIQHKSVSRNLFQNRWIKKNVSKSHDTFRILIRYENI